MEPAAGANVPGLPGRIVGRPAFWLAVVGVLFGAPLARGLLSGRPPAPPAVLGTLPAFDLRDDRGQRLTSESLRGHAFIANVLCTGCGAEGVQAAQAMRQLQHRSRNLGAALWLLSFSPEADAAALQAIRLQHPSSERWFLLAGAPPAVLALFTAGKGLLLVDDALHIRGRYPATTTSSSSSSSDLDAALRDASLVLAER